MAPRKLPCHRILAAFAGAAMLAAAIPASAQAPTLQPNWVQQSLATGPTARFGDSVVYDAAQNQLMLFGGFINSGVANDTWLWNGTTWTEASPATSPTGRDNQTMVYDAATGQVVMFGGSTNPPAGRVNDTWLWNGTTWTEASPSASPAARSSASMAYDAATGQVVLFGGIGTSNADLGDTWLWNGTTWTQASPTTSPSARDGASMAYDAALGEVILFGGDADATDQSDTWAWNGTTWTVLSTANSPGPRDSAAATYDNALGEVVLFGGENVTSSSYFNDTWEFDGTNWVQQTTANAPGMRDGSGMAYDPALGQIVQFGGYSNTNVTVTYSDTWTWSLPQNFGSVNVCAPGTSVVPNCSNTLTLTYNVSATTTFGTPQVVTEGATGLDFSVASGSSCSGTVNGGASCTVSVTFAPQAPGLRPGAVDLVDNSGTLLTSTPIYGNGLAPEIAFAPPPAVNGVNGTPVSTGTFTVTSPMGIVADAQGNLYIANSGQSNVLKVTPSGTVTTVGFGFVTPQGVAVDGAGDLFVADPGLNAPLGEVVEIPAGCTTSACQVAVYAPVVHPSPAGVAVDGLGDLFIADPVEGVLELPAGCASAACQVSVGSGWSQPEGVAVDATGDLFVADAGLKEIVKIPAGCTSAACQTTVGSGWSSPQSVAVDAAGDVFVADPVVNNGSVGVEEVPAGCTSSSCQEWLYQGISYGVATNAAGQVFISDNTRAQIYEVNQSEPPALSFATTDVGSTSDPQYFSILNAGNQPLVNSAIGLTTGFQLTNGISPVCDASFTLAPGQGCSLTLDFAPTEGGNITYPATLQNNSLNGNPATQTFNLSGTAVEPNDELYVNGPGGGSGTVVSNPAGIDCTFTGSVASGTCTASFTGGSVVTLQETPAAGSTFTTWAGACASAGSSPTCNVTVSPFVTLSAVFSTADTISVTERGSGAGTVTSTPAGISCSQTGGVSSGTCSANFAAGSQLTLTAAPAAGTQFMGWGAPCSGTSLTCTLTANSAYDVSAAFDQQNLGNVNVCPKGQNSPAPCSTTLAETFEIPANMTVGAIQVVTQGVAGLDFSLASAGTCTGTLSAGSSCSVNINFAPLASGLRMGAAELYNNAGSLVASMPIYGIGQAPEAAFGPGAQTTVGTGLAGPYSIAVDAAGNTFIADWGDGRVVKIAAGTGVQTNLITGLNPPLEGVAVDGAGNVYTAEQDSNTVLEIPAGGGQPIPLGSGLNAPAGVAVDGAGDVFIADYLNNRVVELPAGGGPQTTVGSGLSVPQGVAVDGLGDVFIANSGANQIVEVTASGVQTTLPFTGLDDPQGVAVDAAGDVFASDYYGEQVMELTPAGVQTTVASGLGPHLTGVGLDAAGDIFIADLNDNRVVELNRSQPSSLSFALTNVDSTSADSPQTVSVQNVGNQTLTGSISATTTSNFVENATGSTCGTFALIPGVSCAESFSFTPQSTGALADSASFSDNTLNLASSVVLQPVNLSGIGSLNGATGTVVPDVVGMTEAAAASSLTTAGLGVGSVTTQYSSSEPAGSVIGQNPVANAQVNLGTAVALLISTGEAPPPAPDPLTFENNYFVTGDYATGGVTLRGKGVNGVATGTITIPDLTTCGCSQGVPDGADVIDGFLYWTTLENTATPSGNTGTFLGYAITGQQIGSDIPYTDGAFSGTLRVYRADINAYLQAPPSFNGERLASGPFTVTLPDSGGSGLPLTEGASMVIIYRALSTSVPLKSVVIYDGSVVPSAATTQNVQGFYDAAGNFGNVTTLSTSGGNWIVSNSGPLIGAGTSQYSVPLSAGAAYSAVILSVPVANSDNDGILDSWKAGPASGFFAGQPGYTDVRTQSWVALPGAKHGEKDLFVQLDWMCGNVLTNGQCDPSQEDLFPSPDSNGNDPLAMVKTAFSNMGIVLHLEIGNIVPESTCTDDDSELCEFPGQPGVIGWKNSLEFTKLWPRNISSCEAGGDCTARFPYGQKDSYHYVLFGHSLAIPAWSTRFGTLTAIAANASTGQTTITTSNRGAQGSIDYCPSRFTISGVLSYPGLNGVYNTASCPDAETIILTTPGVSNWTYANNSPLEPDIGLTSGTVTSISGYSDLGGQDSAVTLALWETDPNQDMSKRAQVIAGTLFHEIGHTLGLTHGGIYYNNGPGSYIPTLEENCKPNYQSVMNYLFQLVGVGPNSAVAYSNQLLEGQPQNGAPSVLTYGSLGSVVNLTDPSGNPATYPTSSWYSPTLPAGSTESAATLHCDGSPLTGDTGYFVEGSIAPITPAWNASQNIDFVDSPYTPASLHGYNDVANVDLRQVGATGAEYASLASLLSFGASSTPVNVAAGGSATVSAGGTVTVGNGGSVTLTSGGSATVGGGAVISGGGTITFATGGALTLSASAAGPNTITPGSSGQVTLPSGGSVTLSNAATITLTSGGTVTLGAGGNVTLGAGGTITLPDGGGSITIPSTGGSYDVPAGGNVTLGAGGNVTLGAGGNVTLGAGGNVTLGAGGNVTLGAGGNVTLGAGGTVTLGGGGNVTLGGGGNVTLGAGGNVTLGAGGTVTLGAGGNVTLGAGGTVTLGGGGDLTIGAGGTITLGAGGNVTLGAGGSVTLGAGGNVTLGAGGTGTITVGGVITGTCSASCTIPAGGTVTLGAGGNVTLGAGGNVTLGAGGTVTLGGGGTVTLGAGGNVTLGAGGNVTLGGGGNVTLGAGGNVTLGAGGNVTLGAGGASTTELDYTTANSVVRPPTSPTYTVMPAGVAPETVQVNWQAPAFGVVQTYTISRSVNGGAPAVIGSVSGVNGNPPATTFTDVNPPQGTLVYTIATTLVPDTTGAAPRQSAPSPPAVLTLNQTIVLGPLPSSVVLGSTQPTVVTATAESNNTPNGQLVSFNASGPCSAGGSSVNAATGVSSATVTLTSTGSCTITASQGGDSTTAAAGATAYGAATPVSGSFAILPQGSTTQSQTIALGPLPSVQYVNGFTVSATASSGLPVTFAAAGPCTVSPTTNTASGSTTGAGLCRITASVNGNAAYSAAAVTQSFAVTAAPLTVTAMNLTAAYDGPLPALTSILGTTYSLSGFVNGDSASVVSGVPALSTTAIAGSPAGTYPITVSTGSLAAANYSFLYVPGTLAILPTTTTTSLVSSTNGHSNYGQLVTFTPTVSGAVVPPGTDLVLYSYTNSTINGGASVSLGTVPLSGGYSTFLLPPGTNTITATFNGTDADGNFQASSASVTQVVASVPVAYLSPSSATFPNTDVGKTSASISVVLTNIGTAPLNISSVQVTAGSAGTSDFIIQSSTCGSSLPAGPQPPGPAAVIWGNLAPAAAAPVPSFPSSSTVAVDNSCTVTLAFAPQPSQYVGPRTGTLVFSDNDGGQTGASDYIGLTGSALSAISAQFPVPPAQTIAAGDYLWFNSELSVQGPLDVHGNPLNMNTDQVQVMVTNGSISFTNPATGATATIPVPDALIQFVPGLTQASTTWDAANNRWVTQVPMADPATGRSQFVMPGNIFMTGVPYLVPAKISSASGPGQTPNVTWSAEFTTDTPGVSLSWQWGAAVYNSCFGNQPTSTDPTCAGDSLNLADLGVLGVNSADPGKAPYPFMNDYDAGTPYSFISDVVPSAPRGGPPNLYTGNASPMAGVVPAVTPVTFTPSPLVFMPVNAGQSSSPMAITITNTNESLPLNISGVTLTGSNAGDFAITGTTCSNANGATSVSANSTGALTLAPVSGGSASSCTLTVVFTPGDLGTRTSSLLFTYATPAGMASNETPPPQSVDLYGTGAGGSNPIVGLSAVSLSFGHQEQGTTSAIQTVTLVNAGGGALTINSIAPSGQFGETSTCPVYPSTLASGGRCTISVWFQPAATAIGAQTGAITIIDNNNGVSGSTQTISLSGEASP